MKRAIAPVLVCALLSAHSRAGEFPFPTPQRPGDAEIHVYLQPLPLEAERFSFSVDAALVMNDAGSEFPLKVSLARRTPPAEGRQRLLASGRVPAGSYAGLSVRIKEAYLHVDKRDSSLLVPDAPLMVRSPFVVSPGQAAVLWLALSDGNVVVGGTSFTPRFSLLVATRPMVGRAGFVSNSRSNSIVVFDKQLRQVAAMIPVPGGPSGMALDQQSARLYVACPGEDQIQVIDVAAADVVDRSRLLPGDRPRELALTPDGRTLVSVNTGSNSVSFFDAHPLTRLERVDVGSGPVSLLMAPSGQRAFVFNALSSSISVVDIPRRSVVGTIPTDPAPLRGQFSPRGDRMLVIHERSPYATVVDPARLSVTARVRLRSGIDAIKVDVRRNLLYLGGRGEPVVDVYDPNSLLQIDTVRTTGGVSYLTIDSEDSSLYMVSPDTKALVIAGVTGRKGVSGIDVGDGAYWVAVAGER